MNGICVYEEMACEVSALGLTEDCLANDIYLATCKPDDWRRGEQEKDAAYGW